MTEQYVRYTGHKGHDSPASVEVLRRRFTQAFPDRPDQLTAGDCQPIVRAAPPWRRLLKHYDVVQAYATDVVWPMVAGQRPYVGFEHGTLRAFTQSDDATSRMTALAYHLADHVLITNGDCLQFARRIHVRAFSPMLHPFDDEFMASVAARGRAIHDRLGVRRVFLCPLRHDWAIKGTDKYVRALPAIAARIGRDFRVIMTRWGAEVADSEALARTLAVDDLIVWCDPLNRHQLVEHLKSVDVVFDQIALPCFGGTAPQSMAVGVPVIMSYDPASTDWLIPEPAPILSAWTEEQIVEALVTALDPVWRADYARRAQDWYRRHHSSTHVVERQAATYLHICCETGILDPAQLSPRVAAGAEQPAG